MATGKPPWSDLAPVTALFKVGSSPAIPPFPETLGLDANDFLSKCFQRDPRLRPSATDLLKHPFVSEIPDQKIDILQANSQDGDKRTLSFSFEEDETTSTDSKSKPKQKSRSKRKSKSKIKVALTEEQNNNKDTPLETNDNISKEEEDSESVKDISFDGILSFLRERADIDSMNRSLSSSSENG